MSNTVQAVIGIIRTEMDSRVKEYNARIAEQQAGYEKYKSGLEARQQSAKDRALLGLQRARFARAGVAIDTGTPLLMEIDSAVSAGRNKSLILTKGEATAVTLENEADFYHWSAGLGRTWSYVQLPMAIGADIGKFYSGGTSPDAEDWSMNASRQGVGSTGAGRGGGGAGNWMMGMFGGGGEASMGGAASSNMMGGGM